MRATHDCHEALTEATKLMPFKSASTGSQISVLLLEGAGTLAGIRDGIVTERPAQGPRVYEEVLRYVSSNWWWRWVRRLGFVATIALVAWVAKRQGFREGRAGVARMHRYYAGKLEENKWRRPRCLNTIVETR